MNTDDVIAMIKTRDQLGQTHIDCEEINHIIKSAGIDWRCVNMSGPGMQDGTDLFIGLLMTCLALQKQIDKLKEPRL